MKIIFTLINNDGTRYEGTTELKRSDSPVSAESSLKLKAQPQPEPQGLPERIIAQRDAGFFREPRTANEVHAKLLESYHCVLNRVQMALLRLHRKRELRKATKRVGDQDCLAYVW